MRVVREAVALPAVVTVPATSSAGSTDVGGFFRVAARPAPQGGAGELPHPNGVDGARTYPWDIPVFLLYHHQREAGALDEAAPMLPRKLAHALDDVVGSENE